MFTEKVMFEYLNIAWSVFSGDDNDDKQPLKTKLERVRNTNKS